MATPKTITDSSSDLDEANLNLFVRGGKLQVKVNYCLILFTASTNTPTVGSGSYDSDGEIVDGDLSWNASPARIDIVLSGFSVRPIAFAGIDTLSAATNVDAVRLRSDAADSAILEFYGSGSAVDPDGDMYVYVLLIGA